MLAIVDELSALFFYVLLVFLLEVKLELALFVESNRLAHLALDILLRFELFADNLLLS